MAQSPETTADADIALEPGLLWQGKQLIHAAQAVSGTPFSLIVILSKSVLLTKSHSGITLG